MITRYPFISTALACASLLAAAAATASPDELAEGGRLYDKWWAEYGLAKPAGTHPAYPATGKQSGAGTWRCKECHGWDYKGRDGAYATGSHYTGIKGIRQWDGGDEDRVVAILKDANHRYDTVMRERALHLLAEFVTEGQMDMDRWVDPATKQVKADADQGRRLYRHQCADCHGSDGRALNFTTPEQPEYLGTIGSKNPWELLHKIANGHPGTTTSTPAGMGMMNRHHGRMPSFRGDLSEAEQADIAAYVATLPPN